MSINVKKFIRNDIYDWVKNHVDSALLASFPSKENFWVTPIEDGQKESKEIVSDLLAIFGNTKIEKTRVVDGIGVAVLREGDKVLVCGGYLDGSRRISMSNLASRDLKKTEISFLQKMLIISKMEMTANDKIKPHIWANSPIFENDLEVYFPFIVCFECNEESKDEIADSLILRFLMSIENGCGNVKDFQDELVEVLLSIPNKDHDWLVRQLLHSVLAGRDNGFYSELYRMVEFFFPLFKVEKLKGNIKYHGRVLDLLDVCMTDLGWHVNHQMGSRLALNYASVSFAEIMLDRPYDGANDEDLRKFKEAAMEKMTDLRHSLVHQKFKEIELKDEDVKRSTKAILSFLASSFLEYNKTLH